MAGPLPIGDPAPADGTLPDGAAAAAAGAPFGAYVHVPFCRVRCGYCDFNTYTATELRGAKQSDYHDEVAREIELATHALERSGVAARPLSTVFFGGGTPTLLPADDLVEMLGALRARFGIVDGAEITTEANPDSVDADYLLRLREGGFTRVSFGVQSAVPETLATLERSHDPAKVPGVVAAAKAAGLAVSVDLIYGAPGETLEQWERSVELALQLDPEHISAYALIVEDGTKLARQIRSGELAAPDDDLQAEMYELADERFAAAGYEWYEISNWSKGAASRSRHNLSYWSGSDWWGFGPGAHSHVGGVRWWNVKHPAAYAQRLSLGVSPAHAREVLDEPTRHLEQVLLLSRIRDGLPIGMLAEAERGNVAELIADGLVEPRAALRERRVVLTRRGRLLADAVVHRLLAEQTVSG